MYLFGGSLGFLSRASVGAGELGERPLLRDLGKGMQVSSSPSPSSEQGRNHGPSLGPSVSQWICASGRLGCGEGSKRRASSRTIQDFKMPWNETGEGIWNVCPGCFSWSALSSHGGNLRTCPECPHLGENHSFCLLSACSFDRLIGSQFFLSLSLLRVVGPKYRE